MPDTPNHDRTAAIINAMTNGQGDSQLEQTLALLRQVRDLREAATAPRKPSRTSANVVRSMQRQIRRMEEHSEMLACALGACPACWGSDPDCRQCAGEGSPGFFLPDEACFDRFVLPVIRKLTQTERRPASRFSQNRPASPFRQDIPNAFKFKGDLE
ncbi:hypothetical protein BVC71_14230 [Marivivens niveibacter]|uniref:Uncharacterized protein n=1 Tax=Marivivens niveibacter TaxID=1930667 RepID=A0A251WVZ8_9RHOB|nr:hypothetical protein [Marivivens niveibacter]OUD08325.1 hypothetical protein BVC71_14230 [Marivivens niveibacter]